MWKLYHEDLEARMKGKSTIKTSESSTSLVSEDKLAMEAFENEAKIASIQLIRQIQ